MPVICEWRLDREIDPDNQEEKCLEVRTDDPTISEVRLGLDQGCAGMSNHGHEMCRA